MKYSQIPNNSRFEPERNHHTCAAWTGPLLLVNFSSQTIITGLQEFWRTVNEVMRGSSGFELVCILFGSVVIVSIFLMFFSLGRHRQSIRKIMIKNARVFEKQGNYVHAGKLYKSLGLLKKAAGCYRRGGAFKEAAETHLQQREFKKALDCYVRAEEFSSAGSLYESLKQYRKAAECFESQGALYDAGRNYEKSGEVDQALSCYLRDKNFTAAANLYLKHGQTQAAAKVYEELFYLLNDNPAEKNGEVDKILALKRAADLYGQLNDHRKLAELYLHNKDYIKAGEAFLMVNDMAQAVSAFMQSGDLGKIQQILKAQGKSDLVRQIEEYLAANKAGASDDDMLYYFCLYLAKSAPDTPEPRKGNSVSRKQKSQPISPVQTTESANPWDIAWGDGMVAESTLARDDAIDAFLDQNIVPVPIAPTPPAKPTRLAKKTDPARAVVPPSTENNAFFGGQGIKLSDERLAKILHR
jgi:tetratricopeptide (TPR) repeat protein